MSTFRTQSLAAYAATIGAPPLAAIGTAHARGLSLHKYSDPVEGGLSGLSPEAALEVALEDVGLLFVEFPDLIPHAPSGVSTEPLHGYAQRSDEGRSRDAVARALDVIARGGTPANLDRRLYGGATIGEALRARGVLS